MTQQAQEQYALRMMKVCEFIQTNLEQPLTLDEVATHANFSKYHFHRQFQAYVGKTLAQYVQLLRLKRGSYELAFEPDQRILDIALAAGFEGPESFARAFKRKFKQTPSEFRAKPLWEPWYDQYRFEKREYRKMTEINVKTQDLEVEVVEMEPIQVAALEHHGHEEKVNETVARFKEWRIKSGQSPFKTSRTMGIAYSDPETVKPEDFRFDVCGELKNEELKENSYGIVPKEIPGGRWARVRHTGMMEGLGVKTRSLYSEWLPNSGEELADFPCYFHYVSLFPGVAEAEQVTDIYLPLK